LTLTIIILSSLNPNDIPFYGVLASDNWREA